jgi:hypothetical protein
MADGIARFARMVIDGGWTESARYVDQVGREGSAGCASRGNTKLPGRR